MVYTVTLNPALDCFLNCPGFSPGRDNRYGECRFLPGGKGVNVSLLLNSLGMPSVALGMAAGFTGRELVELLEAEGCPADFVFLSAGHTRINVKIGAAGQEETGLNGGGPAMGWEALSPLREKLSRLAPGDILVLAGSLPRGLSAFTYARLMEGLPLGVKTVVDTTGQALKEAVKARPFLVKPNLEELGELFGVQLKMGEEALPYAQKLQEWGAENVIVSMGSQGAVLAGAGKEVLTRQAVPGTQVSPVGAGDSLVAGFLYGWQKTGSLAQALDWGMAAGAATAFREGIADGAQVKGLYEKLRAFITTNFS